MASEFSGEHSLTLWLRETFNRVSQRGSRDRRVMLLEKSQQVGLGNFAGLTQRPSDCFVDEVMRVGEQFLGNAEMCRQFRHIESASGLQRWRYAAPIGTSTLPAEAAPAATES